MTAARLQPFAAVDWRKGRSLFPACAEASAALFAVHLPAAQLAGAHVLDLGCCHGMVGRWALDQGAAHYTGVDISAEYCASARVLLAADRDRIDIIEDDVIAYTAQATARFDVVVVMGVLYAFLNPLLLLTQAAHLCTRRLLVESLHPPNAAIARQLRVSYHSDKPMHTTQGQARGLTGRPSLPLVEKVLAADGFARVSAAAILPDLTVVDDPLPAGRGRVLSRYIAAFDKTGAVGPAVLEREIRQRHRRAPR